MTLRRSSQAATGPAPATDKPTILIVDDTPANVALLSEVLRPEYRTKAAVDGEKALKVAMSAAPPDMILLDINMAGMDGYEVCRRLKADPATRGIPVIFVTAMDEVEDEARGLAIGGSDYITKPIVPAIVKARISTHLLLRAQNRAMETMIDRLEAQSAELRQLNATLEQRVDHGVLQLERLGRLKRFFSPSVVDLLLSGTADDPLKTHRREIVAVFLDLRGYTAFTETADPEDVIGMIGEYHAAMGPIVMDYGGTIERFAGDGIMIFFNDPLPIDRPAQTAVRMSISMRESFAKLTQGWERRGHHLGLGIGIAQGYATIGAIGFEGRRDYGVIGNVTNLAARLCGEALGGQILISQRVQGLVSDEVDVVQVADLQLKGFHRPVSAYSVTSLAEGRQAPDTGPQVAAALTRRASDRAEPLPSD